MGGELSVLRDQHRDERFFGLPHPGGVLGENGADGLVERGAFHRFGSVREKKHGESIRELRFSGDRGQRFVQAPFLFFEALVAEEAISAVRGLSPPARVPHLRRENVGVKSIVESPDAPGFVGANAPADTAKDQFTDRVGGDRLLARSVGRTRPVAPGVGRPAGDARHVPAGRPLDRHSPLAGTGRAARRAPPAD